MESYSNSAENKAIAPVDIQKECSSYLTGAKNESREDTRPVKKISDSITETSRIVEHNDINAENRLFGGRLMEWIDEAASLTAIRHSECRITTASIDNLEFKQGAYLGNIIVIRAKITHVGRTSMEIRVDSYREDKETGLRHPINRAYLVVVCIDDEGHPKEVPYRVVPETVSEEAEWEGALKRLKYRKKRIKEGF
ncbi:MAG: acyl-CoA thioesterase [Lachnospiraceae bacterium]|jgi:acyl-CoA hydrolase|nr:acyl-CoA thioesterase [Lachnospiraceae bacterium]MEE3461193.1 acyl-CoA thioesterase [Lachnospiraceae bacterium]